MKFIIGLAIGALVGAAFAATLCVLGVSASTVLTAIGILVGVIAVIAIIVFGIIFCKFEPP